VSHASARLNQFGRGLLICRVLEEGWTAAAAAEAAGVSRATVYKWLARYRSEGQAGLHDRSSCPLASPRRLSADAELRILGLRRSRKLGPHRLAALLGVPRSTCYAVLRRHGLQRLDWMDRPTGEVIRRYERARPGELIHVDVKKLGRIPPGGGWRALGRAPGRYNIGVGYDYVHSAVDDHSRLAYSEIHANERADTCAGFLVRASQFFAAHGAPVERVMTDNAVTYRRAHVFRETAAVLGIRQVFTRSHRPQTNGKVERFNRTLLEEWAYVRPYQSNEERSQLLEGWLHLYNHHRSHTALGGHSPVARLNNLPGNYT
jgi:transposase InsO family protein